MIASLIGLKSRLALSAKMAYNRHLIRSRCPYGIGLRDDGIGVIAETDYICSLSQLARDFIDKATLTAVPFAFVNSSVPIFRHATVKPEEIEHYQALEGRRFDQRHVINFSTIRCGMDGRFCNAITPFWEFQSGMLEHRPGLFDGADVVIAYSDFLKTYYDSLVPSGVKVMKFAYPYFPLQREGFKRSEVRHHFKVPEMSFAVFFNFDFGSCYERKNPEAALKAFADAFPSGDDTALVFKTSHAETHKAERNALQAAANRLGIGRRTYFIDEHLARRDVIALTASADVYISLHRGEGLGMGMLEAMSLGVPVIATAYGGNTDFVREDTAFPIPFKLVPAHTAFAAYTMVSEWAAPDIQAAADAMRRLFADENLRREKVAAAESFVKTYCSPARFKADIENFIRL